MSGERSRRSLAFRTAPAPPPPPPPALSPHCDPEASPPASTSVTCDQPTSAEAGGAEAALEASGSVGTDQDWVETVVVDDDYPEVVSVRVVDGGSISSNESEEEEEQEEEEETAAAEVVEEIGEGERDEEFEGSDGGCGGMRLGSGLTLLGRPQSYLLPQRRTFQRSWLQEFPWLQYDQETGLMYCSWCLRSEGGDLHHNNRNKFVKGSRNYRRTTLLRHHLYTEHQDNDPSPPCIEESDGTSRSIDEIYTEYKSDRNENSYCYQLLQELNEQRQQGILCDVNIVVKGQVFKAHKNILVAGSRYFKTLYCCTPNESCDQVTVTHLDVVAVQGFTVILDFMYSGHLVLTSQNVIEVMSVASYLQMIEIVQGCRGFIKDALNISTKSNTAEKLIGQHEKVKASNRTYRNDKAATIKAEPSSLWVIKSSGSMNNSAIGGLHEERNKYEMEGYSLDMGSLMDQNECYQTNDSTWNQDNFSEYVGKDIQLGLPQDQNPAFSWGNLGKLMMQQTAPRSGRRKNHITRRVVYNVAPKSEEGIEDGLMIQPPMPFSEEGLHEIPIDSATYTAHKSVLNCIQLAVQTGLEQIWTQYSRGSSWIDSASELVFENRYPKIIKAKAGTSDQYRFGLLHEAHNREAWLNGDALAGSQNKFKCPHCNYIAKYRRTLKRHQLIHTGVRSFACDICGKLFTRREHVKRHSLVHKKDKKYKCMVCKKFFTLAASVGIRHGSRRYGVCLDCSGGERQPKVEQDSMDLMVDPEFFKEEPEELEEQDESGGQEQEEERMVDEDVADEDGGLVDRDEWEDAGVNETYVILDND